MAEQAVVLARVAQVAVVREVLIRRLAQQVRQILVAVSTALSVTLPPNGALSFTLPAMSAPRSS